VIGNCVACAAIIGRRKKQITPRRIGLFISKKCASPGLNEKVKQALEAVRFERDIPGVSPWLLRQAIVESARRPIRSRRFFAVRSSAKRMLAGLTSYYKTFSNIHEIQSQELGAS
jgi:hypothetical protein